ncbi:MAG: hypothetical protein E7628_00670 [Ruminococcaceae bacterium]|nr:hypothetical protein [Oscillospiraceae bacterium]
MGWLMDLIMVFFVLLVIIANTKKGCKTILGILVTAGAFAAAYFFGPDVGEYFMTDMVTEKAHDVIYDFLSSVVGETSETITVADLFSNLPESFADVLERVGADAEALMESFGEMTVISDGMLHEMAENLAVPVSRFIASALGCVAVFIAALIALLIAKWLIQLIIKLPVLKQASSVLGFFMGIVSAFVWSWVICIAIGAFIDYSLLGEYNAVLSEIAESSYIFKFFRDFSLVELLSAVKK